MVVRNLATAPWPYRLRDAEAFLAAAARSRAAALPDLRADRRRAAPGRRLRARPAAVRRGRTGLLDRSRPLGPRLRDRGRPRADRHRPHARLPRLEGLALPRQSGVGPGAREARLRADRDHRAAVQLRARREAPARLFRLSAGRRRTRCERCDGSRLARLGAGRREPSCRAGARGIARGAPPRSSRSEVRGRPRSRVEAGQEKFDPGAEDLPHHAGPHPHVPEQPRPRPAGPVMPSWRSSSSAPAVRSTMKLRVTSSITLRLDLPALAARPVAGRVQPGVVGDALMLDLLARHASATASAASGSAPVEMARIRQQFMGEDGGEMLERHGRGEADDRRLRLGDRRAARRPAASSFVRS